VKETLNPVSAAIAFFVVEKLLAATADRRDYRFNSVDFKPFADAIGIIAFIEGGSFENIVGVKAFVECLELTAIMSMAFCEVQCYSAVFINGGSMDFRGKSPARPSQSLSVALFFGAPAA